jgi:hypothetical protein
MPRITYSTDNHSKLAASGLNINVEFNSITGRDKKCILQNHLSPLLYFNPSILVILAENQPHNRQYQ